MSMKTTVRDLMHDADNLMTADEPVKNARQQFELETVRSLILIDQSGPVGILTRSQMNQIPETDLGLPARDFAAMVPILRQSQPLAEARNDLTVLDFDADRIPVVNDEGRFVGVIDREALQRQTEVITTGSATVVASEDSSRLFEIQIGMEVLGADGDKLGKIDQIVLEQGRAKSFTVQHGLFGRHHKRIATDHITSADYEAVHIDFGKREFGFLADVEDNEKDAAPLVAT